MEQKYEALFTPWKIRDVEIKNRIVLCPMGGTSLFGWFELTGCKFDKEAANFFLERAKNNVGLRKFYNKSEDDDEPDMKCDDMMTVSSLWGRPAWQGQKGCGQSGSMETEHDRDENRKLMSGPKARRALERQKCWNMPLVWVQVEGEVHR